MKLDIQAFNLVVSNPVYEGYDTYLLTDDKEKIDYHINMFIVESLLPAKVRRQRLNTKFF